MTKRFVLSSFVIRGNTDFVWQKGGQTEGEGPKASTSAMHRARSHDDKSLSKKSEGVHGTL